jgi:carbonic anhydrase
MTAADSYLAANARHAARLAASPVRLPLVPAQHVAVVACMDSRMDLFDTLGLARGDAHIIRNAGGIVTDDVVRSLAISQRFMQTREIVLVHHTECGLQQRTDEEVREALRGIGGEAYEGPTHAFEDVHEDVRLNAKVLRDSPFIPHTTEVRGFVYDVQTGLLDEVDLTSL